MKKVFCPNCGSENEGMAGGRVTCRACTASFEVPGDSNSSTSGPSREPWNPGPASQPSQPSQPAGWVNPPPSQANEPFPATLPPRPVSTFSVERGSGGGQTNPLAIVSLVLGILCCIPFASIGAIITGVIAKNQIDSSLGQQKGGELAIGGIVLGGLSLVSSVLWIVWSVITR